MKKEPLEAYAALHAKFISQEIVLTAMLQTLAGAQPAIAQRLAQGIRELAANDKLSDQTREETLRYAALLDSEIRRQAN